MTTYRVIWLDHPSYTNTYQTATRGQARWWFVLDLREAYGRDKIPFTIRLSIRKEQS